MSGIPPVPKYVISAAGNFDACAPGHRFNLYFPVCDKDWTVSKQDGAKGKAIAACTGELPREVERLLESLRARQRSLAARFEHAFFRPAVCSAPFATGLGIEHPAENGFAFLTPYGLPYLPGSGVKGVLRRAAEELAVLGDPESGEEADFDLLDVWWLFGFEGAQGLLDNGDLTRRIGSDISAALGRVARNPTLPEFALRAGASREQSAAAANDARQFVEWLETDRSFRAALALRGALACWDVFPKPAGKRLTTEIMTPHFTGYYQGKESPHDAGQPNPIPLLALPARSSFDFHMICDAERLPAAIRERWRPIVERVLAHALDWLGFGAKTAVGYGQMGLDGKALEEHEQTTEAARRAQEEARALARAVQGLPDDAAELERLQREGKLTGSDAVLATLRPWLDGRETLSAEAADRVRGVLESCWKGITVNPDAVQGKRRKPKFRPRPVALAKRFLELTGGA